MRRLLEAIEEWRERLKQRRAFEELASRAELDRALSEAGLADGQLPIVMRAHPRARILCARMMRRLGIKALGQFPVGAPGIERRCMQCISQTECEAWLASAPPGAAPRFCPNAKSFERIRDDQTSRRSRPTRA
ncbi:MAG TPA: DUF6455 family protein [Alphaproteobacteria bacterium]|nr:DUF6455 family protein [Alphaproteobacteria bacterium]